MNHPEIDNASLFQSYCKDCGRPIHMAKVKDCWKALDLILGEWEYHAPRCHIGRKGSTTAQRKNRQARYSLDKQWEQRVSE